MVFVLIHCTDSGFLSIINPSLYGIFKSSRCLLLRFCDKSFCQLHIEMDWKVIYKSMDMVTRIKI